MGSGCSRDLTNPDVIHPSNDYQTVSEEFAAFMSLDSPYNINHKFTYLFEVIREELCGAGIRKTNAYKSKIPLEEVKVKRAEYWDTRVEGLATSWNVLRTAVELPQAEAVKILSVAGMKLVNGSLQLAFDTQGNKYDVPVFCINDPVKYDLPVKKQIKKEQLKGEVISVKFRTAGVANDLRMDIQDNWTVRDVKDTYVRQINEAGVSAETVRLFYGGREMVDKGFVAEYNVMKDLVIQVFKRKAAAAQK